MSVPIAAENTFLVHYTDLDQPGLGDVFNALIEAKVVAIVETGIVPTSID